MFKAAHRLNSIGLICVIVHVYVRSACKLHFLPLQLVHFGNIFLLFYYFSLLATIEKSRQLTSTLYIIKFKAQS